MTQSQPHILVVRGGAIGDFILTLPAIGALRERWPMAHIEILGYRHIIELASGRYYAQRTRSIEYGPLSGFFAANGNLDKELSAYFAGFQLVVSYLYDPDGIFEANLHRVGVKHLVLCSSKPLQLHAAAHLAKPLESLAIYVETVRPRLYPSASDMEFGKRILGDTSKMWCAVHCGSGSPKKNWPVEFFAEVCHWLAHKLKCEFVVVSGEADETVTAEFLLRMSPILPLEARKLRLVELAGVLANCRLYLGNDSGITHMAAAVGTPTIAFWCPHSSPAWQPVGSHVRVIPFAQASTDFVCEQIKKLLQE